MWTDRPYHSDAECASLIDTLLVELGAPEAGIVERLGLALWDVFSDNHEVIDGDGVVYDLGSFRGSGEFIADAINRVYPQMPRQYDYIDFYMGNFSRGDDSDLRRLYASIFARLKAEGCQWRYSFPRLHLLDMGMAHDEYSASFDPEADARAAEMEAIAEALERGYEDEVREARHRALPATVASYRDIFGNLPEGWPHPDM